ncbi:hypothetical protein Q5H91_01230 [Sphingomonas sp. KR1UV-12]|uniref:Uncharacterized protein n=1 Tax=Sphingomonas aurea TaxID=3063994 RepID=A0ABT9EFT0_9SPHN|nr:hypothetical protein [Sphingomonas sp. KR1UV-12]MDP1025826.1 hypothetical protein [Sphingomonas sp. KR1UV-12]
MTRSVSETARPASARYPLRQVPGFGGAAVGVTVVLLLSRWTPAEVASVMATAGLPGAPDPLAFAVTAGIAAGVVVWAALYLIWGRGGWGDRPWRREERRRPLSYADLGPPPPREQPLPSDLDQPLSAFDPEAIAFNQRRLR